MLNHGQNGQIYGEDMQHLLHFTLAAFLLNDLCMCHRVLKASGMHWKLQPGW
jgi:hypothetical protein